MYIENNPLKFVRIDDFRDEDIEKMKKRNIKGAYFGESHVLTTSDESYEQVFDMLRDFTDGDEEWIKDIKSHCIKNIEDYVECVYEQEYYDILGVDGCMANESENVMETIVFAFNEGKLSDEELSDWQGLIDKTVKQHVMEYVADEVANKVKKLKADGYDISELIDSLDKLKQ